jgi:DNA-binding LacI/PurR family transcriptional regulator
LTINDIAKELGISKTTVSRALSGKGRVSPSTRQAMLAYVEEHGFMPNVIARSLATDTTHNLAFIIPSEQELTEIPFFLDCLIGMSNASALQQYDVLVVCEQDDDVAALHNRKVDGIVLSRNQEDDPGVSYLLQTGMPFVLLGTTKQPHVVQVDHDHHRACYELTRTLLSQGDGRPGLLGGPRGHAVNRRRGRGYVDALKEAGIPNPESTLLWDVCTGGDVAAGYARLRQEGARTIFCMDDHICVQLLNHLAPSAKERGEVRIASFYGSRYLRLVAPEVCAIDFDAIQLGKSAGELLIKHLSGEVIPEKTYLDYQLRIHPA